MPLSMPDPHGSLWSKVFDLSASLSTQLNEESSPKDVAGAGKTAHALQSALWKLWGAPLSELLEDLQSRVAPIDLTINSPDLSLDHALLEALEVPLSELLRQAMALCKPNPKLQLDVFWSPRALSLELSTPGTPASIAQQAMVRELLAPLGGVLTYQNTVQGSLAVVRVPLRSSRVRAVLTRVDDLCFAIPFEQVIQIDRPARPDAVSLSSLSDALPPHTCSEGVSLSLKHNGRHLCVRADEAQDVLPLWVLPEEMSAVAYAEDGVSYPLVDPVALMPHGLESSPPARRPQRVRGSLNLVFLAGGQRLELPLHVVDRVVGSLSEVPPQLPLLDLFNSSKNSDSQQILVYNDGSRRAGLRIDRAIDIRAQDESATVFNVQKIDEALRQSSAERA